MGGERGESGTEEAGAQEEGEIQPQEMIINEAIHPRSRSGSRPRARQRGGRNSLGGATK